MPAFESRFATLATPEGWFPVAESEDLGPQEVRPIHYFGQDLVLFRTASGQTQVLDAYCAHLGAHLGFGGAVVGECVRCPFHWWHYDTSGRVAEVPYADRLPTASVRAWPTKEDAGLIFVWHHRSGAAPTWDLPDLPRHPPSHWGPVVRHQYVIKTHPQEIVENTFDSAHGRYVHARGNATGGEGNAAGRPAYSFDGVVAESRSPASTFRHYGLGVSLLSGFVDGQPLYERIAGMTPVDADKVEVRFRIHPALSDDPAIDESTRRMTEYLGVGIFQDIQIWEHKIYRERPRLADRDGPIMQLRRWAKQFLEDGADRTS